jgi:hypothetical protein
MVDRKDVVLAVLGASSAIAGFVLVFFGLTLGILQSYDAETPSSVVRKYKVTATASAGAFLSGMASVALSLWWLGGTQAGALYWSAIATMVLQLALLVGLASWVLVTFVWQS